MGGCSLKAVFIRIHNHTSEFKYSELRVVERSPFLLEEHGTAVLNFYRKRNNEHKRRGKDNADWRNDNVHHPFDCSLPEGQSEITAQHKRSVKKVDHRTAAHNYVGNFRRDIYPYWIFKAVFQQDISVFRFNIVKDYRPVLKRLLLDCFKVRIRNRNILGNAEFFIPWLKIASQLVIMLVADNKQNLSRREKLVKKHIRKHSPQHKHRNIRAQKEQKRSRFDYCARNQTNLRIGECGIDYVWQKPCKQHIRQLQVTDFETAVNILQNKVERRINGYYKQVSRSSENVVTHNAAVKGVPHIGVHTRDYRQMQNGRKGCVKALILIFSFHGKTPVLFLALSQKSVDIWLRAFWFIFQVFQHFIHIWTAWTVVFMYNNYILSVFISTYWNVTFTR